MLASLLIVLVTDRPGPFRTEQISKWIALGPARNRLGRFLAVPRAAWSEISSARKGPGRPETNTTGRDRSPPSRILFESRLSATVKAYQIRLENVSRPASETSGNR